LQWILVRKRPARAAVGSTARAKPRPSRHRALSPPEGERLRRSHGPLRRTDGSGGRPEQESSTGQRWLLGRCAGPERAHAPGIGATLLSGVTATACDGGRLKDRSEPRESPRSRHRRNFSGHALHFASSEDC